MSTNNLPPSPPPIIPGGPSPAFDKGQSSKEVGKDVSKQEGVSKIADPVLQKSSSPSPTPVKSSATDKTNFKEESVRNALLAIRIRDTMNDSSPEGLKNLDLVKQRVVANAKREKELWISSKENIKLKNAIRKDEGLPKLNVPLLSKQPLFPLLERLYDPQNVPQKISDLECLQYAALYTDDELDDLRKDVTEFMKLETGDISREDAKNYILDREQEILTLVQGGNIERTNTIATRTLSTTKATATPPPNPPAPTPLPKIKEQDKQPPPPFNQRGSA